MKAEPADILISYDCTGSMYPCLTQVRREVERTVGELFNNLPDLRMGIITHGDYCDGPNVINILDFTTNQSKICDFIKKAPATSGGDSPECYEYVLNKARNLSWDKDRTKALVLIGDDVPHPVGYRKSYGMMVDANTLDWRHEAQQLIVQGVNIYAVQALGRSHATHFYTDLARIGATPKLDLAQFGQVASLLEAICYKQSNKLPEFEALLRAKATSTIDLSLLNNLDRLAGRKVESKLVNESLVGTTVRKRIGKGGSLTPVHPSRFQILSVSRDCPIKDFVQDNGLNFKIGRGFYEFTKSVEVQEYKEVIVQDKITGEMFSGDDARKILGIPVGKRATVKPTALDGYVGFIQSTSNNRKLLGGTKFLYEVDGF